MASKTLGLSSPELLAEYVRESELRSFFEKRLASPPDHMAMLIRNGEIIDTYKGAHFSIGGILKSLKSLVVGSNHISVLLSDLKPFSVQTSLSAITKDNVQIKALATLELQVNPDKPANVMGLVNTSGFLTRDEVLNRFKPHLTDRVIEAAVRRVNADELRGERGMQDHIQAEIKREIERVAGDLGLFVRAVSLEWAINEVERAAMEKAVLDREQAKLDNELTYLKRNIDRGTESTRFQIEADQEISKLNLKTEEELEQLLINKGIRLTDARAEAERQQELKGIDHSIEVLRKERLGRFEEELAGLNNEVDKIKVNKTLTEARIELNELEQEHFQSMKKLGALTDLEIHEKTELLEIKLQGQRNDLTHKNIRGLQEIEHDGEDRKSDRGIKEKAAAAKIDADLIATKSKSRIAELAAARNVTAEQILALDASVSPEVASVLAQQAQAKAAEGTDVKAMMREMIEQAKEANVQSSAQAMEMFRMGMEGASGVAHGAGGKQQAPNSGAHGATIQCPKCGAMNAVTLKFCGECGSKLRLV